MMMIYNNRAPKRCENLMGIDLCVPRAKRTTHTYNNIQLSSNSSMNGKVPGFWAEKQKKTELNHQSRYGRESKLIIADFCLMTHAHASMCVHGFIEGFHYFAFAEE